MPDADTIEQKLRERYPRPSDAATERARAAVAAATGDQLPWPRRRRVVALALAAVAVVAAGSIAAVEAFQGGAAGGPRILHATNAALTSSTTTLAVDCPRPTGPGYYDTTLSPASGPPGTTVTVSGRLPVLAEDGSYVGQNATEVVAYWNLAFGSGGAEWTSALSGSPIPAVAGSPVRQLGTQDVTKLCSYELQVAIPSVPPGTYPVEVLFEGPSSSPDGKSSWAVASFAPASFEVTAG